MFEGLDLAPSFKNSITAAINKGTLSHALILEGCDEDTRLAAAKEIAAALLCKGENKPCGICDKCRKLKSDNHPDVYFLKKDKKSSMIKIDPIRELKKKALVFPNDGDKSIFIIVDAQTMNPQAQNALLKIFEEPSAHVLFILCCSTKSSLLETVISRATCYSLGTDTPSASSCSPKQEKANTLAKELLSCLVEENEVSFLKKAAALQKDKELLKLCLIEIKDILHDSLIITSASAFLLSEPYDTAKKLSGRLTGEKILRLYTASQELYESCLNNANQNLLLTRLSSVFFSIKTK